MIAPTSLTVVDKPASRKLPPRREKVSAILLHTTGDTDLDAILRWYQSQNGLQPHYVIDYDGVIYRIAQEDDIAWHCLIEASEGACYERGYDVWCRFAWSEKSRVPLDSGAELPRYAEWRDRWRSLGVQSPLDHVTGRFPNQVSVGIELQQPVTPGPVIFTDAQYEAAAELTADIAERNVIGIGRGTVLGHYDCSPMRRSNQKGNWDPGAAFDWAHLFDLVSQVA